jgi:hypothetical protein
LAVGLSYGFTEEEEDRKKERWKMTPVVIAVCTYSFYLLIFVVT